MQVHVTHLVYTMSLQETEPQAPRDLAAYDSKHREASDASEAANTQF